MHTLPILMGFFGSKKKDVKSENKNTTYANPTPTPNGSTSVICNGTVIEGKVQSKANIRLDGKIMGTVDCDAKIVMGETGQIEGEIASDSIALSGVFEGDIRIKGTLHLYKTAKVIGNVIASNLVVESGATLQGKYDIAGEGK